MNHEKYINRCIEISKKGISLASPNPSVGAVLVFGNRIIGEGYTSAFGGAHAEVNCIKSVLEKDKKFISEAILYVSLEPCSHFGKTAPCSLLIIENGIKKVVIGSLDPNPLVAGKGIKMLQEKGIEIETGILKDACEFVNRRFYTFHKKKRPYIILKWAQTANGFFAPKDDRQFWITNKYSKQLVHKWRTEEMAILIGKETAKIDNPRLNARLYKGKNPIRIVIDQNLELKKDLNLFNQESKTIVFNSKKSAKNGLVDFIQIDFSENVEMQILNALYNKGINSVIIEGGAKTLNSFIENNLWDEVRILTGQNELEDGIFAPSIKGNSIQKYTLHKDNINLIINYLNSKK